jgi:hypothetical protein
LVPSPVESVQDFVVAYDSEVEYVTLSLENCTWATAPALSLALRVRVTVRLLVLAAPLLMVTVPVGGEVSTVMPFDQPAFDARPAPLTARTPI